MVRIQGLTLVSEQATLWDKMTAGMRMGSLLKNAKLPIGPDKANTYAAAVGGLSGHDRSRVALALLYCDREAGQYTQTRLPYYAEAFLSYPDDEHAAFFVTALCYAGIYEGDDMKTRAYASVCRLDWLRSENWARFDLPRRILTRELARLYLAEPENMKPERVLIIEALYRDARASNSDYGQYAKYLSRAYRSDNRADPDALEVYFALFAETDKDIDNDTYLAFLYADRKQYDSGAATVFARMVARAEDNKDEKEAAFWAVRLARAYVQLNRMDEGTMAIFRRAASLAPDDDLLQMAYLYVVARKRTGALEEKNAYKERLERAILKDGKATETFFGQRRWDYGQLLRALAVIYGHEGRIDEEARTLYARAVDMNRDDRTLLGLYARALAEAKIYNEDSLAIYERAQLNHQANESVSKALGQTYINVGAATRPDKRLQAIALWDELFRTGQADATMVEQLAVAYTGDDRVNDIALALWEKEVEENPKNGLLCLRLGREWRLRGEIETATKWYRDAAKLMPKDFDAQFETGLLLKQHHNDYKGALPLLLKAIALPGGEKHLEANFALGEILVFMEQREEAKLIFEKIVKEIDPNHTATLLHLAKLNLKYEETGVKRAEALYEQALQLDPSRPETYLKMADLYREKGQFEQEQVALEKFLMLSEPDAERYRQLADLYIRKGDFIKAEGALRQIIVLGQGDKRLFTQLGEIIVQAQAQAEREGIVITPSGLTPPPPPSAPLLQTTATESEPPGEKSARPTRPGTGQRRSIRFTPQKS